MPMLDASDHWQLAQRTQSKHTHAHELTIGFDSPSLGCFALCAIFGNEQIVLDDDNSKLKRLKEVWPFSGRTFDNTTSALCTVAVCVYSLLLWMYVIRTRFSIFSDVRRRRHSFCFVHVHIEVRKLRRFRLRVRTNRLWVQWRKMSSELLMINDLGGIVARFRWFFFTALLLLRLPSS